MPIALPMIGDAVKIAEDAFWKKDFPRVNQSSVKEKLGKRMQDKPAFPFDGFSAKRDIFPWKTLLSLIADKIG